MAMLNKILVALVIAITPIGASAGIMADLNSMFMSNSTAPQSITTKDRAGVFGGSFYMRAPVHSVNIATFDPPRLDAGCGGVDLYGGSFTFISGPEIVALFRAVAANATGLAFKAAIDAISPSLGKLMTEFQTLLQRMNNLAKNSCNLAHLLTDKYDKQITSALSGDAAANNVATAQISDWTTSLSGYLAAPNAAIDQAAHLNPKAGNGNYKAIIASGASDILGTVGLAVPGDVATDPNAVNNRVLISLLGFHITAVTCQIQNQVSAPNTSTPTAGTGMTQNQCSGENSITLNDIIKGGGAGSSTPTSEFLLWECVNPTGSTTTGINTDPQICTIMKKSAYQYSGIQGFVNTMLFGTAETSSGTATADSIVGKFNSGASVTLDANQVAFINQSGVPLIGLFLKTSNPNTRAGIAAQLEKHITSCIAAKVGESLYKSANSINDVTGYELSDDSKSNIEKLRIAALHHLDICNSQQNVLAVTQRLDASIRINSQN
jgi:conjugative transfer pilus assembly protein TraH